MEVQAADLEPQTAAFQCKTTNVTGPPVEAQRDDFNGQTTTSRVQDVVKEATDFKLKAFGNERATISGSVISVKNEPSGFNPQDFGSYFKNMLNNKWCLKTTKFREF